MTIPHKDHPRVAKALALIEIKHAGHKYSDYPFTYHLHEVAKVLRKYDADDVTAALLHDILEDTNYTVEELIKDFSTEHGMQSYIPDIVRNVTQNPTETYNEYILRVSLTSIQSRRVKVADLSVNLRHAYLLPEPLRTGLTRRWENALLILSGSK